jgi:hypothetical protein
MKRAPDYQDLLTKEEAQHAVKFLKVLDKITAYPIYIGRFNDNSVISSRTILQ